MAKKENDSTTERTSGPRGMKIVRDFARDNSDLDLPGCHGKALGGSATNLSHSLTGASAVEDK